MPVTADKFAITVDDISNTTSILIIAFIVVCLILICIFVALISERVCPLCCLCCCPLHCHDQCSSNIHRLSDTHPLSRKQLSLRISQQAAKHHSSVYSQSQTSNTLKSLNLSTFQTQTTQTDTITKHTAHNHSSTPDQIFTHTVNQSNISNATVVVINQEAPSAVMPQLELQQFTSDASDDAPHQQQATHTSMVYSAPTHSQTALKLSHKDSGLKPFRSLAGLAIDSQSELDEEEEDIMIDVSSYSKPSSPPQHTVSNEAEPENEETTADPEHDSRSQNTNKTQHQYGYTVATTIQIPAVRGSMDSNSAMNATSYSARSPATEMEYERTASPQLATESKAEAEPEQDDLDRLESMLSVSEPSTCCVKLLICVCLPYCYWDSNMLKEYKKKRTRERLNGTTSKSFKARIISNIAYFGLAMNVILLLQCVSIFVLLHFRFKHGWFMNLYYLFHNLWLILCNVALTGILLNVLQMVRAANDEPTSAVNKKRLKYTLITFCALFIVCTVTFHCLCLAMKTILWDYIGGIIRNLLICVLCLILARSTFALRRSVLAAFKRVRGSINNKHQVKEHKKVVRVLVLLFVSSVILACLVSIAAFQYFTDLLWNDSTKLKIGKQASPMTYITDYSWLFIKLMSSFIILYYALINIKQRRRLMITIINEQVAILKDNKRSKRKRSFAGHRTRKTI